MQNRGILKSEEEPVEERSVKKKVVTYNEHCLFNSEKKCKKKKKKFVLLGQCKKFCFYNTLIVGKGPTSYSFFLLCVLSLEN